MNPVAPTSYLLHQLVAEAVRRSPDASALRAPSGGAWSYRRLWAASGAASAQLRRAGLRPGARVGVWMRKSCAAVASMLGVLRAGGVYVPFDAWAPEARIAAMSADCALWGLFADAGLAAAARRWNHAPAWIAAVDWEQRLDSESEAAPAAAITPEDSGRTSDDLAYILYTSGSTGVPKGVMLTHAHALNFVCWAAAETALAPGDCVASHAPFHFDLSVFDVWATLSRGATVCLLDPVTARFPAAVAEWIGERGIRVWYSTPSALAGLSPHLPRLARLRPGLRTVVFAGEAFPPVTLRRWRESLPGVSFHNWYGPTETNVCTHYRLPPLRGSGADPASLPAPPIGRACPNFELALLDETGRPVAERDAGLLWVRGPGVMAGYWGDETRTAEVTAWRPPAAGGAPQRWYNTGDWARLGRDGELYFEGRRDARIKLRGYRVSLLEVEAVIASCPGVGQAVVVALPLASPPERLHAFVTAADGEGATAAEIRAWARQHLPVYMVPDAVEVRSALPLTSTGKLDRRQLAQQATGAVSAGASG